LASTAGSTGGHHKGNWIMTDRFVSARAYAFSLVSAAVPVMPIA